MWNPRQKTRDNFVKLFTKLNVAVRAIETWNIEKILAGIKLREPIERNQVDIFFKSFAKTEDNEE